MFHEGSKSIPLPLKDTKQPQTYSCRGMEHFVHEMRCRTLLFPCHFSFFSISIIQIDSHQFFSIITTLYFPCFVFLLSKMERDLFKPHLNVVLGSLCSSFRGQFGSVPCKFKFNLFYSKNGNFRFQPILKLFGFAFIFLSIFWFNYHLIYFIKIITN